MPIVNMEELATTKRRRACLEILDAGLGAADPAGIMPEFVTKTHIMAGKKIGVSGYSRVHTVAFGKAGDSMTRAFNGVIPVYSGIIVMPKGSKSIIRGRKFQIFNAGHPVPDKTSTKAAKEVVKFLQNRRADELVVFLVSGGASALLALPDRISLGDKIHTTELLLKSGATIQEINCVRKHLSKIKGGRLVAGLKCQAAGLIMSDVEGDDISAIASGVTAMDRTTFADALGVIAKYGLGRKIPQAAWRALNDGAAGRRQETPKSESIQNRVIASNATCLDAMQKKARTLGYRASTMQVFGDIKNAVKDVLERVPEREGSCLIFGGETTTRVAGRGIGGRNHEMVLRLLKNTQGQKRIAIASIGTDGIDGSTRFAGAITENAPADTNAIKDALRRSDSGGFFGTMNASVATGPTHTNLMDIGVILR